MKLNKKKMNKYLLLGWILLAGGVEGVLLTEAWAGILVGKTGIATWGWMNKFAVLGAGVGFVSSADFGGPSIPSSLAFFATLRAIRGLRIWERSSFPPIPGVYVKGFLSLVSIAFWIAAGGSYASLLGINGFLVVGAWDSIFGSIYLFLFSVVINQRVIND